MGCFGSKAAASSTTDLAQTQRVSLKVGDKAVTKAQVEWQKDEEEGIKTLFTLDAAEVEEKFKALLVQQREGNDTVPEEHAEMTKTEMRAAFVEMGINIAPELFDKMWLLFDADRSGTVNTSEFVVTFCVLMYRGSAKDNVQLAFRLFDTNRDGGISRRELNDMVASIIGTKVKNLLAIELGRECFEQYLQTELSDELLRFVDAVEFLHQDQRVVAFERDYADSLFEQFVEVGSPDQINVSDSVREKIRKDLAALKAGAAVPAKIFDAAAEEAVVLIEEGPLVRFKLKLHSTFELFADKVWTEMGLESDDTLTEYQFRVWAERTPGLFAFFDDLHDLLRETMTA